MSRPEPHGDPEARFRSLVQSPLRAGLLRFLSARPEEAFEVESLMATFGRMRLDIENCLRELVEFGIVGRTAVEIQRSIRLFARRATRSTVSWTHSSSGARTSASRTRHPQFSASAK